MIAIIRIKGLIGVDKDVEEAMYRIGLRKKFVCVILRDKPETLGIMKKLDNFTAYGKINKETFLELIKKRAKGKKVDAEKITSEFFEGKTEKTFEELGIKSFFRLHPPRGGFESKMHFPKGILGNHHDKINDLIRRML